MIPPSVEPELANWAACAAFSPSTSIGWICGHRPAVLQRGARGITMRGVFRVGDRKPVQPTLRDRLAQVIGCSSAVSIELCGANTTMRPTA